MIHKKAQQLLRTAVTQFTVGGAAGSATVASGNTLRARFAFTNYSTESVNVIGTHHDAAHQDCHSE